MSDISLFQYVRAAGSTTLLGMAEKLGVKAPPPVSVRNLLHTHTLCTFRLDSFSISNTRSRHTDTDFVSVSLRVGANDFGTLTKSMGDLNNGTYQVGLEFPNVAIDGTDAETRILFIYQIVNAGNDPGGVDQRLESTADVIAGAIAGGSIALAGPTGGVASVPGLAAAGVIEALSSFYSWLTVDCDGPVAVDAASVAEADLFALLSQGPLSKTINYPGTDSPAGCGSNSQYSVTWSVTRAFPTPA